MDFMNQCLENQELLDRLTDGLELEEKHLVHLELMIMEQVEDWEMDIGKISQDSGQDPLRLFRGQSLAQSVTSTPLFWQDGPRLNGWW